MIFPGLLIALFFLIYSRFNIDFELCWDVLLVDYLLFYGLYFFFQEQGLWQTSSSTFSSCVVNDQCFSQYFLLDIIDTNIKVAQKVCLYYSS